MRYLLFDRVLRLERNHSLRAVKSVSLSEDFFADHFLGFPVMPGALLIETAAQAATVLLEVSCEFRKKALLAMVDRAKFRSMVRPGDRLIVDVTLSSISNDVAQTGIEIRSGDVLVMDARLVLSLQHPEPFYPKKTRHLVETAYDVWLQDAEMVGFS
jgi:3-hydroxyacyl-[acyl-carrier-protein] dehydratase